MTDISFMRRNRTPRHSNQRRARRGDRGATMVEAAFVMPVFIVLIFGIFEFSGYVMARTGAGAAVKGGTRLAIVAGNDSMADRQILLRIATEGSGIQQDDIQQVIIWHAAAVGESPPTSCLAATGFRTTISGCNVYNDPQDASNGAFAKARLPLTTDTTPAATMSQNYADYWFGCDTSTSDGLAASSNKLDCGWEPHTRRILEQSPTYTCSGASDPKCAPTDLIGIYIKVQHSFYTNFFRSQPAVLTSESVSAIEPQGYDK